MRLDHSDMCPAHFDLLPNKDGIQLDDEVVALWDEVRGVVR